MPSLVSTSQSPRNATSQLTRGEPEDVTPRARTPSPWKNGWSASNLSQDVTGSGLALAAGRERHGPQERACHPPHGGTGLVVGGVSTTSVKGTRWHVLGRAIVGPECGCEGAACLTRSLTPPGGNPHTRRAEAPDPRSTSGRRGCRGGHGNPASAVPP
jgi:hypothetical protein